MDKGRFLIETHLRTKKPIAELAAAHGVSRSWLYKLLARYRTHGLAGLEPRSRRPHRSPTRIADAWE
ncbi:MAG TPA: leucine zipper domain-containing protein, partial [Acidimicrobiales bacterium]|nr:leucine zipper domain-containing protein [Acidimicrobiales bacterium]